MIPDSPDFTEVILEKEHSEVPSSSKGAAFANGSAPKRVRRLKANEVVSHGDFVSDGRQGLELWAGPGGFRADAFLKPIYRLCVKNPPASKKSKKSDDSYPAVD